MEWHLFTAEYPPQPGGVSDYSKLVADGLASEGDSVHVWCPADKGNAQVATSTGVNVHRQMGLISRTDLRLAGKMLDQFQAPRRLLVQWVPHGYGYRAMNVPFCLWLWNRVRRKGDVVEIMAHECFLPFKRWAWKQNFASLVQRVMTMILLRATRRVWISIPAWEKHWRPLTFGRPVDFRWLPVPSNIEVLDDPKGTSAVRQHFRVNGNPVLGHFGTYGSHDRARLKQLLPLLMGNGAKSRIILMGRDSDLMLAELIEGRPDLAQSIHATGTLDAEALSRHLSACDVMLQPCQDGVSSRRGTVMAALSHGRPIVTTSGRLTESMWHDSQAVVLAPDSDIQAIALETLRLLGDGNERQRLGKAARQLYQEMFDVRHVIAALREAA
jgi:glycosyltransferase involved in cell wall biosynthesis